MTRKFLICAHLSICGKKRSDLKGEKMTIQEVLMRAIELKSSDIHFIVDQPPMFRMVGELLPSEFEIVTKEWVKSQLYSILSEKEIHKLETEKDLDIAYSLEGRRMRINMHHQQDSLAAAFRVLESKLPSFADLGLPKAVENFANLKNGLVLITGPTGSGKSTTLAALIHKINMEKRHHIITVEDPIEYVYDIGKCTIEQREVGRDAASFESALKYVLRQDPDVILIGEMRTLDTIQAALTAAETGHLVFSTLHTNDAPQTIDRIIDVFPAERQEQIRLILSNALKGVVCQELAVKTGGKGRVMIPEVLVVNHAISNQIREGNTNQIYNSMNLGASFGMITKERSLQNALENGLITQEEYASRSTERKK